MLEKIICIKNVGRFRDYNARGDVSLRKINLVYADNGRGKTTLCAILRSLQSGKSEYIIERKTLGSSDEAFVQLRLDGATTSFNSTGWSSTHPEIALFDSEFIHSNVYSGDIVDHEHKKNLYRVIVGAQGKQLAKDIDDIDGLIREANSSIRDAREAASRTLPSGISLEQYLLWQPEADVDQKVQEKKNEISRLQRTLDKATEIQTKNILTAVILPSIPPSFLLILKKQLTDISSEAEAHVRRQINNHYMGSQGETWLSQGLGFVVDEKCPFCGQVINGNDLIASYRSHFNASYKELKTQIALLSQEIGDAIGETSLNTALQAIPNNLVLVEFWKQFMEINLPLLDIEDIRKKYKVLNELALFLVQRKQQLPTEPIIPESDFNDALAEVTNLQMLVSNYNSVVSETNNQINALKSSTQQSTTIVALKGDLARLEANKIRFEKEVSKACSDYQSAQNSKSLLDRQKSTARNQLDQYCQQILQTYQSSINTYLDQFNAGFRITNSRHLYTGGSPSSQYQIEINSNPVELGDSRTQPGIPCFRTTLSSGDRSALAFAFFLASLKNDAGIGNKIVVFDDPFTSQDRYRRTCTQQLIRQFADMAHQVIVLSHDPHFLRLIWEGHSSVDVKTIQICPTGDKTVISEWDIESETQSHYLKNYSMLLDFYRDRKGDPINVVRSIRPFIEGLLRIHFPGHFLANEWLGDFINKIRSAANTDGLSHAQADLEEIVAINDFSKKYHHEQNSNADSEPISDEELHGYVKRTLRLVGGC